MFKEISRIIAIVDDILTRYIKDEAGKSQELLFLNMNDEQKVRLFVNTFEGSSELFDFETDLIINFDYMNF